MSTCRRYVVRGRVQGVGFRAATRREARRLGLTGWVRNNPQGFVEVLAAGPCGAMQSLHEWLRHGPRAARVTQVECVDTAPPEVSDAAFEIR